DRYTTEIVGNEMQMLGGRGGAGGGGGGGGGQSGTAAGGYAEPGVRAESPESAAAGAGATRDEFDDDIPF
ncbi:MAG TPA: ssDNA-binding protein, partial [Steroidobacteraceae bacterium]|nr:ssDNA-binding protein [Steroidobacteraceae bacterium]